MEQRLTVRIAGPGVPVGKIGLKDLQRIVHPLEQAVRALLPAIEPRPPTGGRPQRPAVRLLLSGIEPGSAVANLELDAEVAPTFDSLAPDPLGRLVAGRRQMAVSYPTTHAVIWSGWLAAFLAGSTMWS